MVEEEEETTFEEEVGTMWEGEERHLWTEIQLYA